MQKKLFNGEYVEFKLISKEGKEYSQKLKLERNEQYLNLVKINITLKRLEHSIHCIECYFYFWF